MFTVVGEVPEFRTGVAEFHDHEGIHYCHALNKVKKYSRYKIGDVVQFNHGYRVEHGFALVSYDRETMKKTLVDGEFLDFTSPYDMLPKYIWDPVSELDYSQVEQEVQKKFDLVCHLFIREGILGIPYDQRNVT
jgi:hypothetical protein